MTGAFETWSFIRAFKGAEVDGVEEHAKTPRQYAQRAMETNWATLRATDEENRWELQTELLRWARHWRPSKERFWEPHWTHRRPWERLWVVHWRAEQMAPG